MYNKYYTYISKDGKLMMAGFQHPIKGVNGSYGHLMFTFNW